MSPLLRFVLLFGQSVVISCESLVLFESFARGDVAPASIVDGRNQRFHSLYRLYIDVCMSVLFVRAQDRIVSRRGTVSRWKRVHAGIALDIVSSGVIATLQGFFLLHRLRA